MDISLAKNGPISQNIFFSEQSWVETAGQPFSRRLFRTASSTRFGACFLVLSLEPWNNLLFSRVSRTHNTAQLATLRAACTSLHTVTASAKIKHAPAEHPAEHPAPPNTFSERVYQRKGRIKTLKNTICRLCESIWSWRSDNSPLNADATRQLDSRPPSPLG